MAPRALKDKQILACKQLYLTNPEGANLSRFLLGKVVSLPRSGRTSYLIEWDRASLNSILPQTSHHLIQTCIGNNDSNRRLIGVARDRYLASSSRSPEQNTTRQQVSQDVQRQLLLQRIMTSPISRRSTTGIVYDSSDSSSSEEEIDGEENEDVVHARFDSSYDVDGTENLTERDRSNVLLDSLLWDFKEYSHTDENLRLVAHQRIVYTEKTVLKTGVATSFNTPLEAFQVVGGVDYETVKRLCRNSNEYMRRVVIPRYDSGLVYGLAFVDISVTEMMNFFGIMLRMSLNPIDYGGYQAYFNKSDIEVQIDSETTIKAFSTGRWASDIMDLRRYKIIRMAFHPEDRLARECGDKCYHVRYLMRQFKSAAKASFIPGRDIAFDEGGIGSRHRLNPIRQFNHNKPQKFRVDFFICSTTENDRYVIMHMDIYQGKNARNIDIHQEAESLGTTMKAVVNAVCQLGLVNDPRGSRIFALDNR